MSKNQKTPFMDQDNELDQNAVNSNFTGNKQRSFNVNQKKLLSYQIRIFLLTYLTFSVLHFNRESWAILKPKIQLENGVSSSRLGLIDTVFLCFYSIGLFVSGSLGDHYNPKYLLIISFVFVTLVSTLISIGALYQWQNILFYCSMFAVSGIMQSCGWPSCTAIFANWFGKRGRGTTIGFWQSSGNFGNIGGAIMTSFLTATIGLSWQYSYLIVAQLCLILAVINIFALVTHPQEVDLVVLEYDEKLSETEQLLERNQGTSINDTGIVKLLDNDGNQGSKGISFIEAWKIPGVIAYSLSYFCIKFSNYGLMFWLPLYLSKSHSYSDYQVASATSALDMGSLVGGVLIGYCTDLTYSRRSPILVISIILTTLLNLMLVVVSPNIMIVFLPYVFVLGVLMGGAIAIVSAISCADLGKLKELSSNEKSLGTVTGIIDGTGSLGAALGQFMIGWTEQYYGWNSVFIIMSIMVFASALPLYRSMKKEFKEIAILYRIHKERKQHELEGKQYALLTNEPPTNQ